MTPDLDSFPALLDRIDNADGPAERRALAARALDALDANERAARRQDGRFATLSASVEAGLTRLRGAQSSARLLDDLCGEAARSCALDRVLLSRVSDEIWYPWLVHPEPSSGKATALDVLPVPLADAPIEREVLASGRPVLVADVAADPRVHRSLTQRLETRSYVVAPLTPGGRPVGLLHADSGRGGRALDATDRDVLWTFAEGVGRIYERLVLHERLVAQRASVREAFGVVEDAMGRYAAAEVELVREALDPTAETTAARPATLTGAASGIDTLLTEREREVLAMMLRGHTNQTIAERLVIREGTVKSHVKHILRKTGAANRTEVISRYAAARG